MASLAVLLLACLVCGNYILHRDVLYPGFLQASLWFVAVSLLLFTQGTFIPVSNTVFILLVAGVVLFSMGAFVSSYNHAPYLQRNHLREGTLPSKPALVLLVVIVLLGLIPYVSRVLDLASTGPSTNPFVNLRYNVSVNQEETGGIGRVSYFVTLSCVLVGTMVLKRDGPTLPTMS